MSDLVQEGTSQDQFLSLNDVMFTCHVLFFRHQKASSCQIESLAFKAPNAFVLALVEEK